MNPGVLLYVACVKTMQAVIAVREYFSNAGQAREPAAGPATH